MTSSVALSVISVPAVNNGKTNLKEVRMKCEIKVMACLARIRKVAISVLWGMIVCGVSDVRALSEVVDGVKWQFMVVVV